MDTVKMRLTRAALIGLLTIETLAGYGLVNRRSAPPVIFGRYSPQYFPILMFFGLLWLATLILIVRPPLQLSQQMAAGAVWMRKRWWLAIVLIYGAFEGWYAVIDQGKRFFFPDTARRPFMTALLLLLVWGVVFLIFAGRPPDKRRETAFNLALALTSVAMSFWVFSQIYARVIQSDEYGSYHHEWAELFRVDLRIGYRGRPNLEGFVPRVCPDVTYAFDQQGFRNSPDAAEAAISVVGSSYTWGPCLENGEIWPAQLSSILNREVIGYSVPGAVLWHENRYIDLFVTPGDNKILIYAISPLTLNPAYMREYDQSVYDRLAVNGVLFYLNPVNYTLWQLFSRSPATLLREGVAGIRQPAAAQGEGESDNTREAGNGQPSAFGDHRQAFLDQLILAQDQADGMNMRIVFVTIPSSKSTSYQEALLDSAYKAELEARSYAEICQWVSSWGGWCYDTTPDMRQAAAAGQKLYLPNGGHLNAEGARYFARLVADYLEEHSLLAP